MGVKKTKLRKLEKGPKRGRKNEESRKLNRKFQLDPGDTATKDVRSFYLPTLEQLKSRP